MFSKPSANTLPATMSDAGRKGAKAPLPKVASIIGGELAIKGDLIGAGDLHLDGVVHGDVRVERLTIGEGGQVVGSIMADNVEVRGKVMGAIVAPQVRLYGSAHVAGDITHEQLSIETGAFFEGRSLRLQRPAAAEVIDISAQAV